MTRSLKALFVAACLTTAMGAMAQEDVKAAKLPPMKDLPAEGEMKSFYELDADHAYTVFDRHGKELLRGKGRFVDVTDLEPGVYIIRYGDRKVSYVKE
jgi:uncharacterized ParB-like nuclease family protein